MFYTQFSPRPTKPQPRPDGTSKVERGTYRSVEEEIMNFFRAGRSLMAARQEQFNDEEELANEAYYNEPDIPEAEILQVKPMTLRSVRKVLKKAAEVPPPEPPEPVTPDVGDTGDNGVNNQVVEPPD